MKRDKRYTYKALVKRVIDGDTYDVEIDLGFDVRIGERIRLLGIDTPETHRPKTISEMVLGEKATQVVKNLIEGKHVILETFYNRSFKPRSGKYGRILGKIEVLEGAAEGRDLGDILTELQLLKKNLDDILTDVQLLEKNVERTSINDATPEEWDRAARKAARDPETKGE